MKPTPIGVNHDRARFTGAATAGSACFPGEGGVCLGSEGANLLGLNSSHNGGEKKSALVHLEQKTN